jgi:hypothetical protein
MESFLETLREQRWDDHRYYHHSRINQTLHLLSASSFLCAYVLVFKNPAAAVLIAWLVGMTSRQIGHFFFEPRDYDEVNEATHDHKEEIKVGYNLRRKVVLMTIWAMSPLLLFVIRRSSVSSKRILLRWSFSTKSRSFGWRSRLPGCYSGRSSCSSSGMLLPAWRG